MKKYIILNKKFFRIFYVFVLLLPSPVLAANCSPSDIEILSDVFNYITCVINKTLIPMFFALALAMFVYGVINFYFINGQEEAKRNKGKQFMIWGIIALTVMTSVWGLVNILGGSFNLNTKVIPTSEPSK